MTTHSIRQFLISPTTRIAFGLVMFTLSLLLVSDLLGFLPDHQKTQLESRKFVAETIALQTNLAVSQGDTESLQLLYDSFLSRNDSLSSLALLGSNGETLVSSGNHESFSTENRNILNSNAKIIVEVRDPQGSRSELQMLFTEANTGSFGDSILPLLLYFSVAGFIGYAIFLRRVLKELDPKKALPDRVRSALDTLTEGLMIVDHEGLILFLNDSLATRLGIKSAQLLGSRASDLRWFDGTADKTDAQQTLNSTELPWERVLAGKDEENGRVLSLQVAPKTHYNFSVNTSSILDDDDSVRGVLITLSDITQIEIQRDELKKTLRILENTQSEITRKNEALYKLATRDPLTGLLNRRAFFEEFDKLFEKSIKSNTSLVCLMTDIDNFKFVNDTYGHSVGDEVIQYLANVLTEFSEDDFIVGRFGGEEFAILIPDKTLAQAAELAENMRVHIELSKGATFSDKFTITACFGVAGIPGKAQAPRDLLEYADAALYFAKDNGRNSVVLDYKGETTLFSDVPGKHVDSDISQRENSFLPVAGDTRVDEIEVRNSEAESAESAETLESLVHSESGESDSNAYEFDLASKERRRFEFVTDDAPVQGGAQVLETSASPVTERSMLVFNIEQSLRRSEKSCTVSAVLILNSSTLVQIHNSMGFVAGFSASKGVVERLSWTLRNYDLISQPSSPSTIGSEKSPNPQSSQEDQCSATVVRTEESDIAILVSALADETDVDKIVDRIRHALAKPVSVDGYDYTMETSIGVATSSIDSLDGALLLKNAGIACAAARKSGRRNSTVFYSESIDREAKRQLILRNDLSSAAVRSEFQLFYQPKYDLSSGEMTGLEALLRWHHRSLGNISAAEFIPLAEELDVISDISQWTIREAMDQLQTWVLQGHKNISIAINVSASELRDASFVSFLIAELEHRQLRPENLELEITETAGIESSSVAAKILNDLSDYGFIIAIDDFGTGFASLSYLQAFPIDRIKIDRSFVTDLDKNVRMQRLLRSILSLGACMDISVLAEGVETREELAVLQEQGCEQVQGYLTGRPVDADVIGEQLRQSNTRNQDILKSLLQLESSVVAQSKTREPAAGGHKTSSKDRAATGYADVSGIINQFATDKTVAGEMSSFAGIDDLADRTGTDG